MAISQNFPNIRPSLNLNFARSKTLDPHISFGRNSIGTYVNDSGLIKTAAADEPRFDHDPNTNNCLGLLIEQASTNLCFYGTTIQNFTARNSATLTANAATAPDGTTTATRLQSSGSGTGFYDDDDAKAYTSGKTYTFSCFFKANGTDEAVILLYGANWTGADGVSNVLGTFDLTNGTVVSADGGTIRDPSGGAKIESYPNGWYRCSITETCTTTHTQIHQNIRSKGDNGDIYAWGYQIEECSYASSLIPTTTNATASREKEIAKIDGTNFSDFYNPSESSIYVRFNIKGLFTSNGYNKLYEINDGTSDNRVSTLLQGTNSNIYETFIIAGTNNLTFNNSSITLGDFHQVAVGFGTSFQRYTYDASGNLDTNTDTSIGISTFSPTQLNIGSQGSNSGRQLNGYLSQLVYYPTKLTDDQLQNLILQ